jgi:hypothetical protein
MRKQLLLLFAVTTLLVASAFSQQKAPPASQPTPLPANEQARLWLQACSPLLQVLVLLAGLKYTARNFQIGSQKHQAEWYSNFRSLHRDFWKDDQMAKARKWIANPTAYRNELLPVLQKRAVSPEGVTPAEYDLLETIDRFCATLETAVAHNAEVLSVDHQWMIETTFGSYWVSTVLSERLELKLYMMAHWPRLMRLIDEQNARRVNRPRATIATA